MLSLNFIREHPELVLAGARRKGEPVPLDRILELDRQHRLTLHQEEEQRQLLNRRSQEVGKLARSGAAELERERSELGGLKASIQELQQRRRELQAELDQLLLLVPNPPHDSVPDGTADEENVVVRTWGERPRFDFTPLPHHELGERLGIFDFERAVKVAGTRFALLQGDGARLERALTSLMLDLAREHGYREVSPPYMVNREAMVGTANLPKFEDEAFHVLEGDRFLIPTAEVPLTNLYAGEILEGERLPIRLCAWTPCWRSEAGAPGKDTHGYIRLHQFSKVELVKLSRPEDSLAELESLVADSEAVLQTLGLHYRVRLMCSGDMGFAQWKKYDLDAWAPGLGRYLEVSSCSVFADFQARRAGVRFRDKGGSPAYVHTLNGSALALPRTFDCVLETFQTAAGTVRIPEPLRSYLGGLEELA